MTVEIPPPSTGRYFPGLDVLRFAAALMVMLFHFTYLSSASTSPVYIAAGGPLDFASVRPVTWAGWIGVQIFFVISGIVIAISANGCSPASFLRSRMTRLLPSIWICATVSLITAILIGTMEFMHILRLYNGTLLVYPHGFNAVYWTLRIEIAFYAFVFLLLCVNGFRHVEKIAGFMAIGSLAFWLSYDIAHIWTVAPAFVRATDILRKCMPVFDVLLHYGCFFALGIYLWLLSKYGPTTFRQVAIICCLIAGCLQIEDFSHAFIKNDTSISLPISTWLLSVLAMHISLRRTRPSVHKFIRILGLTTYPLYLVHDFMGSTIVGITYRNGYSAGWSVMAGMAASIAISIVIARYLEPPLRHVVQLGLGRVNLPTRRLNFLRQPTVKYGPSIP